MTKRNLFAGKLIFLLLNFTSEFTLLSNGIVKVNHRLIVLLYSEFTLLSDTFVQTVLVKVFYCILNLHYSQTLLRLSYRAEMFYCILNLHYSQTGGRSYWQWRGFYCILNSHYSQTAGFNHCYAPAVLMYSEFTLLSNYGHAIPDFDKVLMYSEFTLLSNRKRECQCFYYCFTVFWIYTTLKRLQPCRPGNARFYCILNLHYSQTFGYS